MKKPIISIFLFISIISLSLGQNVNISSSFDSSRIYVGDQIKYTITIDKPSDLKLTIPIFKDTLCKNIEIISGPRIDSSSIQNGRIKIVQKYLITSFDSGRYQVRPVFAEAKNEGGVKRFYSDYSMLEVMRVKIAPADTTAKIFDIIKPYKAPVTVGEVLPWVLLITLAGVMIWVAIRFLRNLKKSETGKETFVPPEPAHVIAFRELERLKNEELWQKGETKKYYTMLTEILRQYLENRYSVFSLELTTSETLEALVKTGFKKNGSYNDLKSVLKGADLVKFAKYNPIAEENESHFQNSWNFVLATKENEVIINPVEEKISAQEGNV
ncbi:MAG: hypothetical protein ABR927_13330 [Bacteroidales bacterium]|jgi:hypothetical protein